MTEHKKLYDSLLTSGDLFDLDVEFTGVWEKDKKLFVNLQDSLEYLTETEEIFGYDLEEEDFFDE